MWLLVEVIDVDVDEKTDSIRARRDRRRGRNLAI
jgi:hypothetical protein